MRYLFLVLLLITLSPLQLFAAEQQELPAFTDIVTDASRQENDFGLSRQQPDSFSVVLKPRYEAILAAEVDAKVKKIVKEFGQSFRKGQPLLQLDATLYTLLLKKAQAIQAKEQSIFDAVAALYKNKSRSIIELEEARVNLSIAKSEAAFARHNLARCTVRAPYDGRVEQLAVNEQEWVKTGDPLLKIVADSTLLARTLVPARYLSSFTLGKEVEIVLHDGQKITGKVSHLGAVMDSASQTFEIDVEVPNTEGKLIGGMTGKLIRPEMSDE